jgi:hypothetical protein
MSRVNEQLRREDRATLAAMTVGERVTLALGARDVEAFRLAHDPPLAPAEAVRLLQRQRQAGRRRSRRHEEVIG